MTWRRQIDYHGSRTYQSPTGRETAASKIKRGAQSCLAWLKHRFKTMLRLGIAPATDTRTLIAQSRRGFSLLGSAGSPASKRDCPFPEAPARNRHPIAPKEWV
jgi:hypothetical protein